MTGDWADELGTALLRQARRKRLARRVAIVLGVVTLLLTAAAIMSGWL